MPKVVIQARMGSKRLPGKVLMGIGGKAVLQWVVDAANNTALVDDVIVATPDDIIVDYCKAKKIGWVKGPEDDVLERFKMVEAETFVRLTADCPFVDPEIIDICISRNACAVDEWPDGMDVQVFERKLLEFGDKEHVVPVNNYLPQLPCSEGNLRHIRVTLDTIDDLDKLRLMAKFLPTYRPPRWRETLSVYNRLDKLCA